MTRKTRDSISIPRDIYIKMQDEYSSIEDELRLMGIYSMSALVISRFFYNSIPQIKEVSVKKRVNRELSHLCFRGAHEGNEGKIVCKGRNCLCKCHNKEIEVTK